jgi:glucose/arabinose dehydrogenase
VIKLKLILLLLLPALILLVGCGGSDKPRVNPMPDSSHTLVTITEKHFEEPTATVQTTSTASAKSTVVAALASTPHPIPKDNLSPSTPAPTSGTTPLHSIRLERVFPELKFQRLTNLEQPDDGQSHMFVTEQPGRIHVFPIDPETIKAKVFLDIRDRVSDSGNEEGLLGLAFDAKYSTNGYFYVFYSASSPRRSVLSRFSVNRSDPNMADPSSETIILEIPQPYKNHNGGQIAFGADGYLYIGLGDGGSGSDPMGNAQNIGTLLGAILRIDVWSVSENKSYGIPIDNPFVGIKGAREEIWAYGLRNPWRFSFDATTGLLWAGDVGQRRWEEIDIVEKGVNYGWNTMEGGHCFSPTTNCDTTKLALPVAEYDHSEGCSITGGYVYRGGEIPWLLGTYLYGDYCSGKIWGLHYNGDSVVEHSMLVDSKLSITSFGQGLDGSLYVLSRDSGIYRVLPSK